MSNTLSANYKHGKIAAGTRATAQTIWLHSDAATTSIGESTMANRTLDLSVVIVSWNVKELLRGCLQSIYDSLRGLRCEIFVVDNASHDGGPEMVRAEFPDVHLIVNSENLGFGCANNQALQVCSGRYVLLINPDTIVPPGVIHRMIDFMKRHPQAGLAGPELLDGNGRLLVNWVRWSPRHMAEFLIEELASLGRDRTRIMFQRPRRVRILTGACWLARYDAMAGIGFYDEDFFMYAEEPDICTRMRDAGWEIWLLRDIHIIHYKKQSVQQRGRYWHLPLFVRNMALWLTKRWRIKHSPDAF
jgi:GT2 family glycosyltransferase